MNKILFTLISFTYYLQYTLAKDYPQYPMLGSKCKSDKNCTTDGWESCDVNGTKTCIQKPIFPMFGLEYVGNIFIMISLFYANIGGLGGGGTLIPTCVIFFNFDTKNSIMMSNITICIASIYRQFKNWTKKNPENGYGTIIDYSTTLIMLPAIIVGSAIGTFINIILPEMILDICIIIFLAYLTTSIGIKMIKICKMESKKFAAEKIKIAADKIKKKELAAQYLKSENLKHACVGTDEVAFQQVYQEDRYKEDPLGLDDEIKDTKKDEEEKLQESPDKNQDKQGLGPDQSQKKKKRTEEQEVLLAAIKKRESSHLLQGNYVSQNFLMMLVLVVIQCIRGKGDGTQAHVVKCSGTDWFLFALLLFIACVITTAGIIQVKIEYSKKVEAGYDFIEGSLKYTAFTIFKCLFASFSAGFLNGALGIGTGLMLNPFLIQVGLCTLVASASGVYLVIYGTLANTIIQIVLGRLNGPYALNLLIMTILGTAPGILAQDWFLRMFRRQSIVIADLITLILYTLILIPVFQFRILAEKSKDGINIWATSPYCPIPVVAAVASNATRTNLTNLTNATINGTKLLFF